MAAHRYWAVDILGSGSVGIRRIQMRTSIGGPSVTSGGTAFGTQSTFFTGGPELVFDSDESQVWGTNQSQWSRFGYDFGTPVDIVEISIRNEEYGGATTSARQATLSYSDDGVTFFPMAPTITALQAGIGTYVVNGFADPVAPRVLPGADRLATTWPAGPVTARVIAAPIRYDPLDGGPLKIAGTVKIKDDPDVPVSRRVRLFDRLTGRLVRETWSAADGSYAFEKLRDGKFFLVAHDHTLVENAAIKDEISPQAPA